MGQVPKQSLLRVARPEIVRVEFEKREGVFDVVFGTGAVAQARDLAARAVPEGGPPRPPFVGRAGRLLGPGNGCLDAAAVVTHGAILACGNPALLPK
jgi:hypothetical protein